MSFIGFGLRRKRNGQVLDVTFGQCQSLDNVLSDYSINQFTTLNEVMIEKIRVMFPEDKVSGVCGLKSSSNGYCDIDCGYFYLTELTTDVKSAEEAYFKLHLISQRLVKPHGCNLTGLFGHLTNVCWTNKGPILPNDIDRERLRHLLSDAPLVVSHVDKFPYLVNYVVPSGVRIASGSQVRLGAYLSEGTTVMPAGYINFNAGTNGPAMVEGRISAGVVVGANSDIGGGASIMGTLSGGNKDVLSIGEQCLLGANAGAGISLGKGCTIEAGLYITAGMPIYLLNQNSEPVDKTGRVVAEGENIVKAKVLSGMDYLLFINDRDLNRVVAKPNTKLIELNQTLH